ncbi:trichohyalin-like [Macrobrachium rosenbergii]|uniref:trichohyalin-like n=1 Tax=Macrobrachium rosenbergii TaxID=79674 RepID=UPI0034D48555
MFAFQVFAWNVLVLALIACELYLSIEEDLLNLLRAQGITGHLRETLHHAVVAESWTPEVVETRPNSGGIETSAFVGAVPRMALMAGALAVLLAVYWRLKLIGCDDLDREEDDLEVPALDVILETEDMESLDEEEEEEEEEEEIFGTEELYSIEEEEEEEEEDEIFESEILNSSEEEEEEEELEDTNQEPQLLRQHPEQLNEEKQTSAKELEISQVNEGLQLERLLDEAKKEIVWLQNQILDKDLLLEKKAAEGTELKREIEHLSIEKEQMQAEKQKLEDDYEQALGRGGSMETLQKELMNNIASLENQLEEKDHLLREATKALNTERAKNEITGTELEVMRNWVSELGGENTLIKEDLEDRCLDITVLRKELGDEQEKTQILREEVQVMKNWVTDLGAKNITLKEGLEEALLEVTTLQNSLANEKRDALQQRDQQIENFASTERKLICEKQDLEAKLEVALSHGKELERERSEMTVHYQERLNKSDNEKEMLREREEQLQENLESALHQQQNLECSLKLAEGEICSLKKAENTNLCELEQLRKECERLKEKCRMQEENTIEEQKRVREHLRMQEEELRNHDKYMLMTLLHGTAQRNFLLEHIALDCRNKTLDNKNMDNNSKEEEPHNCVETTEGKDQGQEENRCDQVRKVEEEQYRMYHNAQQEKDDYGKQWEDLTQMVEDLIRGDE